MEGGGRPKETTNWKRRPSSVGASILRSNQYPSNREELVDIQILYTGRVEETANRKTRGSSNQPEWSHHCHRDSIRVAGAVVIVIVFVVDVVIDGTTPHHSIM